MYREDKGTRGMTVYELHTRLLPVGSRLYLDLESRSGQGLRGQTPERLRRARLLEVRLNVPTDLAPVSGEVYVTYLQTPVRALAENAEVSSCTIKVRPWELVFERDAGEEVVEKLYAPH